MCPPEKHAVLRNERPPEIFINANHSDQYACKLFIWKCYGKARGYRRQRHAPEKRRQSSPFRMNKAFFSQPLGQWPLPQALAYRRDRFPIQPRKLNADVPAPRNVCRRMPRHCGSLADDGKIAAKPQTPPGPRQADTAKAAAVPATQATVNTDPSSSAPSKCFSIKEKTVALTRHYTCQCINCHYVHQIML